MPSLPTPVFLPAVDPTAAALVPSLALIGPLLVPASLVGAVVPTLPKTATYIVDISAPNDVDPVLLLNNGAIALVVSQAQLENLSAEGIPSDRLIVKLGESELASAPRLAKAAAGLYVTEATKPVSAKSLGVKAQVFVELKSTSASTLVEDIKASLPTTIVVPTSLLTNGASTATHVSIADAFLAPVISDRPDGLFPTIVSSSTHSSRPLGMVYSSRESVSEAIKTQKGVYQSRKHGLWRKGETSGSVQDLVAIELDCDTDSLVFQVVQHGTGFCHLGTPTCFGSFSGLARLEDTLKSRLESAPEGSYTKRLFTDEKLLRAKILEEAEELCDAQTKEEVAFEAADLFYFALARAVSKGVSLKDIELALDAKALKVTRRKGDAKPKYEAKVAESSTPAPAAAAAPAPVAPAASETIRMKTTKLSTLNKAEQKKLLLRPVLNSLAMIDKVKPIVERVRTEGDAGLKAMTKQFDKAELSSNIQLPPFATPSLEELPPVVREAIDQAYLNVKTFHAAQVDKAPLKVETMPGVVCSRFARPIQRVGIYVPGGTAILPSTAIMLGVPAQVAGCKEIVLATPPRADGSISPEVLYVAQLTGVTAILKAGGAQAVAAMAYGTGEVPKVDKIFGPGNQWVTAAKMYLQNDTDALIAIDMPAGPSEVLVMADSTANPVFVASDLLSQAEHGVDSQVVLVAINLTEKHLAEIEAEVDKQARALPRVEIARQAIAKSLIVLVDTQAEGIAFSNEYAPEHLILHLENAPAAVASIDNAGSVFVGAFTPESCGDYASGTNHTLPTNGYARQFSGVNTASFQKSITSQEITREGLSVLGPVVVTLAEREGLDAHANAVRVRLQALQA
ncbi:Histidine biosynthesis trifunctional protein [Vanrija pseudolonga]|uniref:Histidine biosynthesis trifunctional protein n=1 Tax=Vanrija pseudolonga TaxID=143232 RepID=A0AAF0YG86_9TREE|nr:Histidine biosynthesis trifunctional protein [Vanrija pseudolonga]